MALSSQVQHRTMLKTPQCECGGACRTKYFPQKTNMHFDFQNGQEKIEQRKANK
jgi:hypothetical protein